MNNKTDFSISEKIRFMFKCFLIILKQDWLKVLIVLLYSVPFLGRFLLGDSYLNIDFKSQDYIYIAAMYIASIRVLQLQLEARIRVNQKIAFCFSLLFVSCYYITLAIIIH